MKNYVYYIQEGLTARAIQEQDIEKEIAPFCTKVIGNAVLVNFAVNIIDVDHEAITANSEKLRNGELVVLKDVIFVRKEMED